MSGSSLTPFPSGSSSASSLLWDENSSCTGGTTRIRVDIFIYFQIYHIHHIYFNIYDLSSWYLLAMTWDENSSCTDGTTRIRLDIFIYFQIYHIRHVYFNIYHISSWYLLALTWDENSSCTDGTSTSPGSKLISSFPRHHSLAKQQTCHSVFLTWYLSIRGTQFRSICDDLHKDLRFVVSSVWNNDNTKVFTLTSHWVGEFVNISKVAIFTLLAFQMSTLLWVYQI